jgi:predicted DNA-binding transcriptional regulator YafY
MLVRLFPAIHEQTGPDRIKRWYFQKFTRNTATAADLVSFSADEIAALEQATKQMKQDNLNQHAVALDRVRYKLQCLMHSETLKSLEPDLSVLIEAEGLASRAGPKFVVDPEIFEALRAAVINQEQVRLYYWSRSWRTQSYQDVCPYGFLYGKRHYLVAYNLNPMALDYRLFSLADVEKVEALGESFDRDQDFSLDKYARQSFGVFQEKPFNVVWKFSADVAEDALSFQFHPDQTVDQQSDGTVVVKFTAGGFKEMVHHLLTWEGQVEVIEPKEMRDLFEGEGLSDFFEQLAETTESRSQTRPWQDPT